MIILICAGWYRNGMVRRELSHSKCAGSGFPYRIARSRILLSKPWPRPPVPFTTRFFSCLTLSIIQLKKLQI